MNVSRVVLKVVYGVWDVGCGLESRMCGSHRWRWVMKLGRVVRIKGTWFRMFDVWF